MKAIILTGTFVAFIIIYSWVLVFSVVHHTQNRIDRAVAEERASCDARIAAVKAQLSPAVIVEQTETVEEQRVNDSVPAQEGMPNTVAENQTQAQPTEPLGQEKMQVPFEAQAAARAKYVEGLNYFNQDDYVTARQLWLVAVRLDPNNVEAQMGLTKVEELLKE